MKRTLALVAVLSTALLAAGCGSDSDEADSTSVATTPPGSEVTTSAAAEVTTAPASSSPAAATGEPVKIMLTGVFSSSAASFPSPPIAAAGAVDAINAAGGVNGRPIDLIVCDDHLAAPEAAICARKAVDENVMAVVGAPVAFTATSYPTWSAANIPHLSFPNVEEQAKDPISYPISGGNTTAFYSAGAVAAREGGPKVAMVIPDFSNGGFLGDLMTAGIESEGGEVVSTVKYTIGTPDMSATAAQLMDAKPDAIATITASGDTAKLIANLRQAGFTGVISVISGSAPEASLKQIGDAADNTFISAATVIPSINEDESKQFRSEVPDPEGWSEEGIATWVGLHAIADAMKTATTFDGPTLMAALDSATDLSGYGMVESVDFTAPAVSPNLPRVTNGGVRVYEWKGGTYTEPSPGWISVSAQ